MFKWDPVLVVPVLFALFVVAGVIHGITRTGRDRHKDLSERYAEGGELALRESYYVLGVEEVYGEIDWAAHMYPQQQVNLGIMNAGRVTYITTNYLDLPCSKGVQSLLSNERVKGMRGVFKLARVRQTKKTPSLQPYMIIDFRPA